MSQQDLEQMMGQSETLDSSAASASEWMLEQQPLDISQMDKLVESYRLARLKYEAKKKESADLYHELEEAESLVRNALLTSGKSKYFVDGIGTVSIVQKSSFQTPKDYDSKKALFDYIQNKYGEEALVNYLSIHSASLNSFANKELESDPTLQISGLTTPTITTELRFRKD